MNDELQLLLDKVPGWKDRRVEVTELEGGLTNQNFRVEVDGETFVLRACSTSTGPLGINRDHEYACAKVAAELGIAPQVVHYSREDGILVSRFLEGRPLSAAEARQPDTLERIVHSIKRFHYGPAIPGQFSAFQTVRRYQRLACERGVSFPDTMPEVFPRMEQIERALDGVQTSSPCHNDLLAANFLDDGERVWIIDWEYGGMGAPMFDLGNFAVNQELSQDGIERLVQCYFGRIESADLAHVKLMMLASDLREAFWGYLQSGISSLNFDYGSYATRHLERFFCGASAPAFRCWLRDVRQSIGASPTGRC